MRLNRELKFTYEVKEALVRVWVVGNTANTAIAQWTPLRGLQAEPEKSFLFTEEEAALVSIRALEIWTYQR